MDKNVKSFVWEIKREFKKSYLATCNTLRGKVTWRQGAKLLKQMQRFLNTAEEMWNELHDGEFVGKITINNMLKIKKEIG